MHVVAGVDFGTLSVRVSFFGKSQGTGKRLVMAAAEYPLHRHRDDPNFATQSHDDHMAALERAMHEALRLSSVSGDEVEAIAIDTTGSSVIIVGEGLKPIGDYYLWCDHRSWREADEITAAAHRQGLEAIEWCGGTYSSEWGFSKVLHWLRNNPEHRSQFVTALEHCDMAAATLCGIPQRNDVLNQIYANVLNKPVLVPQGDTTSLGSAIFAFPAAGEFKSVEEAQDAFCAPIEPSSPIRKRSRCTTDSSRCIANCTSVSDRPMQRRSR
jgi:L-ribulokinase